MGDLAIHAQLATYGQRCWCGSPSPPRLMTAATTPEERWRLGYRPALDGLRGIAIALVLVGHSQILGLGAASTVGVTLFFVLSGFLITTLLLEERERTGGMDLVAFYKRRARRLLPALVVFLAVIGVVLALTGSGDRIVGSIAPPLFYYANWVLATGGELWLLAHTWSLSVEEQFYIAWPLLLLGLLTVASHRSLAAVMLIVAGLIAAWRYVIWDAASVERIARGTDMRADALLIGCAVAFLFAIRGRSLPRWLVVVAVLMVAVPSVVEVGFVRYGIGLTSAATGGALLVVLAATRGSRLLEWQPLVWLGSISYGVYLWQTPAISLAKHAITPVPLGAALGIMIAVGLAVLSRRYVEVPFLRSSLATKRALSQ
jgi:peptidoglycan/LPS O-acetylase OafA/YrhL